MSDVTYTPENTVQSYRDGDVKIKAAIRKLVQSEIMKAVAAGDLANAQAWVAVQAELAATPKVNTEINPVEVIARRAATLRYAADMLLAGVVTPDGLDVPDEMTSDGIMGAYDALDWSAVRDDATKLATAKITRSSDTHSLDEWFARAFEGLATGTVLTVAQIITRGAVDGDPYRPSSGAVTSRIKGGAKGCTVAGIERAVASDGTTLAARKVN